MSYKRHQYYAATNARSLLVTFVFVSILGTVIALTPLLTPAMSVSPLADDTPTTEMTHSGGVSHSVSVGVLNDSEAFSAGQVLTDESLYPRRNAANPVVTGKAEAENAAVSNLTIHITYTATESTGSATSFYSETDVIAVADPDPTTNTVNATVPISEILEQKQVLEDEFGDGTTVIPTVQTEAQYTYETIQGQQLTKTVRAGGPVTTTGNMYSIASDSSRNTHQSATSQSTTRKLPGSLNVVSLFIAFVGFLWIFPTIVFMYRVDKTQLQMEIQEKRFKEWVTEVKSFTPEAKVNVVEVVTLNDLVNLAIDTQNRVLYHERVNEYIVVDGENMFKYTVEGESSGATEFFGMEPENLDMEPIPDIPDFD